MKSAAAKALEANTYVVGSISPWTLDTPTVKKVGDDCIAARAPDDAPGVDGETADEHESHIGFDESAQQLVECGFLHRFNAAPVKRMSL